MNEEKLLALSDNVGNKVYFYARDVVMIVVPDKFSANKEDPKAIINATGGHIMVGMKDDTCRSLLRKLGYEKLEISNLVEI